MVLRLTQFIAENFKYVVYNGDVKVHEGESEAAVIKWLNREGEPVRGSVKTWKTDDGIKLKLVREIV